MSEPRDQHRAIASRLAQGFILPLQIVQEGGTKSFAFLGVDEPDAVVPLETAFEMWAEDFIDKDFERRCWILTDKGRAALLAGDAE